MNRHELKSLLQINHKAFTDFIEISQKDEFEENNNGKWSIGQNLDHMIRSIKPLLIIMDLPKPLIGLIFGKNKRQSRSYEELVNKYQQLLKKGGKASGRFLPKPILFEHKTLKLNALNANLVRLIGCMESFDDAQMEKYVIPHPLLGKLSIKEMMYFCAYHVQHHLNTLKNKINH